MTESIYLMNVQATILQEIRNPRIKRKDVALTYRYALESDRDKREEIDWGKINRAIIERWSESGLKYIKTLAWSGKILDQR